MTSRVSDWLRSYESLRLRSKNFERLACVRWGAGNGGNPHLSDTSGKVGEFSFLRSPELVGRSWSPEVKSFIAMRRTSLQGSDFFYCTTSCTLVECCRDPEVAVIVTL
jgi:hypothetical protein